MVQKFNMDKISPPCPIVYISYVVGPKYDSKRLKSKEKQKHCFIYFQNCLPIHDHCYKLKVLKLVVSVSQFMTIAIVLLSFLSSSFSSFFLHFCSFLFSICQSSLFPSSFSAGYHQEKTGINI